MEYIYIKILENCDYSINAFQSFHGLVLFVTYSKKTVRFIRFENQSGRTCYLSWTCLVLFGSSHHSKLLVEQVTEVEYENVAYASKIYYMEVLWRWFIVV